MTCHVSHVPCGRRAAARKLRRDVDDGHERKLHAAERLGLMKPEQAALVQELLVLTNKHARVLGALGALAQDRHDLPRAPHRLAVIDAGEIAPQGLRQCARRLASAADLRSHRKHVTPYPANSRTARAASAMARCA